jgi:hypothetical protein
MSLPTLKFWLDDIRRPPGEEWMWARRIDTAKTMVRTYGFDVMSLDHDLGLHNYDPDEEDADLRVGEDSATGYDFVKWLCDEDLVAPVIIIHSWNPVGAKDMAYYLANWAKHVGRDIKITVHPWSRDLRRFT